ncbi:alanine dehydrogenase [Irregularibacter muris]|uniref:Alanine dehydrogenase n=1 Tax=Irregularibacter muris TaxID=1796619 RepID=A0AAE3L3C7_9FIRM|nr:alanine dehydrogenase [Irregularibacter muris]MCR1898038.1 alanine dehydrogenase [Irregularibacter muris]
MIIGVPKEIKTNENRVGITPAGVESFLNFGHEVYIEKSAGLGSGFTDEEYIKAGAKILENNVEVFEIADMILKVKQPLEVEYNLFKEGQILFTYLHLAPEPELTKVLLEKKIIGIAYETVQLPDGSLPLLSPMSEVAGRMSIQVGANLLEKINNGRGVLLGGVPGVAPAEVVVVGGGNVGTNAAKIAIGLGARVTIIDISPKRLAYLDDIFGGRVITLMSNSFNIAEAVRTADLVVGAVLIPGSRTPKLVTEEMVKTMKPGAVLVDVAIDQGGAIESIDRITTHENPYFVKHNVIHYSVANMPGAVPRTSTLALTNSTIPYALEIANKGCERALKENESLRKGLNLYKGRLTYKAVADDQGLEYIEAQKVLL